MQYSRCRTRVVDWTNYALKRSHQVVKPGSASWPLTLNQPSPHHCLLWTLCMIRGSSKIFFNFPVSLPTVQLNTWRILNHMGRWELRFSPSTINKILVPFIVYCINFVNDSIIDFLQDFLAAAFGLMSRDNRGYFFDSCIIHCQSLNSAWNKIKVKGQSAAVTFSNWYFNRTGVAREVDCPYPCNKSC